MTRRKLCASLEEGTEAASESVFTGYRPPSALKHLNGGPGAEAEDDVLEDGEERTAECVKMTLGQLRELVKRALA